jgi:16S rRNA C967 or C1407 C5-methylase (RsmB/RsmF family)
MFTWLNKQGVKSTDGFEVQFTGRFTAEYREGERVLVVDVEGGANGTISFDPKCFERWANSSVRNTAEEQARMIKNFLAALEFQGLKGLP